MKRSLLAGDSGGTGTDWCYIDQEGEKHYFSTQSYQPVHFSDDFFEEMRHFWSGKRLDPGTVLHFYGAGCSMRYNQETLSAHFKDCGFTDVSVESDLLGAARALFGDEPGIFGILGTGSVLAAYDGNRITGLTGGYGYLLGDEGGGYAFGRLLLKSYMDNQFSAETHAQLLSLLGSREEILKKVYAPGGKQWISSLALQAPLYPEIILLHRENIRQFVVTCLQDGKHTPREISFAGSYASGKQEILQEVLAEKGWKLSECLEKPIRRIAEYSFDRTI